MGAWCPPAIGCGSRGVGEHEDRGVEHRIVAPPAIPPPIPRTSHGAEHVASDDDRRVGSDLVDHGPVLLSGKHGVLRRRGDSVVVTRDLVPGVVLLGGGSATRVAV